MSEEISLSSLRRDTSVDTRFHSTLLSHIVTGESVGSEHYAAMAELTTDVQERSQLVRARDEEQNHHDAILSLAKKLGVSVECRPHDAYWGPVRTAFAQRVREKDLASCYLYQDVVIETFATVLYEAIEPGLSAQPRAIVARIASEEREHLAEGGARLRRMVARSAVEAQARVWRANDEVARVLSMWMRPSDCEPVCGVCGATRGSCFKQDLSVIGVNLKQSRIAFFKLYGDTLRQAGLPVGFVTTLLARLA